MARTALTILSTAAFALTTLPAFAGESCAPKYEAVKDAKKANIGKTAAGGVVATTGAVTAGAAVAIAGTTTVSVAAGTTVIAHAIIFATAAATPVGIAVLAVAATGGAVYYTYHRIEDHIEYTKELTVLELYTQAKTYTENKRSHPNEIMAPELKVFLQGVESESDKKPQLKAIAKLLPEILVQEMENGALCQGKPMTTGEFLELVTKKMTLENPPTQIAD